MRRLLGDDRPNNGFRGRRVIHPMILPSCVWSHQGRAPSQVINSGSELFREKAKIANTEGKWCRHGPFFIWDHVKLDAKQLLSRKG